jgi:hypothetical protein
LNETSECPLSVWVKAEVIKTLKVPGKKVKG